MQTPFQVRFETGAIATRISLADLSEIPIALQRLGLLFPCPTLVIVGGASGLAPADLATLRSLFQDVICPFATTFNLTVVDGGTDAGVMQLMGQARAQMGHKFPLIGVIVAAKAILPETSLPARDSAALEPNHTHFLLVPGQEWGDESRWIANVASVLAGKNPSLTVLINGGEIALHQDVPNSLDQARPVLVIGGSGRAADRLANALNGETIDPEVQTLINSGLLQTVNLQMGKELLRACLEQVFMTPRSLQQS